MIEEAAALGETVTRAAALAKLAEYCPEAAELIEAEGGEAVN